MFSKLKLIDLLLHLFHLKYFSHAKSFPITTYTPVLTETSAKKLISLKLQNITIKTQNVLSSGSYLSLTQSLHLKVFRERQIHFTLPPIPVLFETSVKKKAISLLATKVNPYNTTCF